MVKIANESQWNTEDLTAITERVIETLPKKPSSDCLLVFKTCRYSRTTKEKKEGALPDRAAQSGYYHDGSNSGGETRCVQIYSKDRLTEKNVLDRLAQNAANEVRQDIHPRFIRQIAESIRDVFTGYYYGGRDKEAQPDCSWAEKFQLRASPKIEHDPELVRRKIVALEQEKERSRRTYLAECQRLDGEITRLKGKLETKKESYKKKEKRTEEQIEQLNEQLKGQLEGA